MTSLRSEVTKNLFYIIDLVAVSNRTPEAAEKQAAAFGIEQVMTADEIAASGEIELVVNLTPAPAHYGVIKRMLEAGKHVYTEKPFAVTREDARKVLRLAEYVFTGDYDRETILKWLKNFYRRFFSQQFKRSCLPDGPKVGSVAVSPRGDLRMPSDASAAIWLEQVENLTESAADERNSGR